MQGRTYRYFTGTPLYPFGHGLSYTRFAYSPVSLSRKTLKAGETLEAAVTVANAGTVPGDEVVQAYLSFPDAPGMPVRALRGFRRVTLTPGARQQVRLSFDARALSSVSPAGERAVVPGRYRLTVGGGQPGTGAPTTAVDFTVRGRQLLPK